jgi:hypothetical protein
MSSVVCVSNYEYQGQVYSPAFSEPSSPSNSSISDEADIEYIMDSIDSNPVSPMSSIGSSCDSASTTEAGGSLSTTRQLIKRSNSDSSLDEYRSKMPRFANKYEALLQPLSPVTTLPVEARRPLPPRTHKSAHDVKLQNQFESVIAATGNAAQVEDFLNVNGHNIDINQYNDEGRTPLQQFCYEGNLPLAKIIVKYGGDVRLTTRDGFSTLHVAAFSGHSDLLLYIMNLSKTKTLLSNTTRRR